MELVVAVQCVPVMDATTAVSQTVAAGYVWTSPGGLQ